MLGRNGTYVVFRKLHTRTAAFRQYLHQNAKDADEEEWLAPRSSAAGRAGRRWPSAPDKDDPELGADPSRNNAFMFGDDPQGLKCPVGSHVRRMNPRDAVVVGEPRHAPHDPARHHLRAAAAPGVLEDDGADRGLMFAFVGAHLDRQFEFVQSEWINDGKFIGSGTTRTRWSATTTAGVHHPEAADPPPPAGPAAFVVNRGGEYGFMPGLQGAAAGWPISTPNRTETLLAQTVDPTDGGRPGPDREQLAGRTSIQERRNR